MDDAPRSNRPTPRTSAATEAELRRRIRLDLQQARSDNDGELDDDVLAAIVARAIASALSWHTEGPQHTRAATSSSRNWRPAGGPRGGPRPRDDDFEPRGRPFPPNARPPRRWEERPEAGYDQGYAPGYDQDDAGLSERPPRPRGPQGRYPSGGQRGGRGGNGGGGRGGFGPPRRGGGGARGGFRPRRRS